MRNYLLSILAGICSLGAHSQNIGIGTAAPSNKLHIVTATNPLRLEGLQSGNDTDSILTVSTTGVVRRRSLAIASAGWNVAGNGGINPAINFIGTLNNVALVFRTNNLASGFIDPDLLKRNNAFGNGAMQGATIAGSGNNAFGYQALRQVNNGNGNVALGDSALYTNNAGSNNIAIGANTLEANLAAENIAIGSNALLANISGSNNIAIGISALSTNQTQLNNIAIGGEALKTSNANDNLAVGYRAGLALTTGIQNTAVGNYALLANTGGNNNTLMGYQAAQLQTSGSSNTYIGFLAGGNFLGGSNNTMIGNEANALVINSTFSNSTALGSGALIDRSNMVRLGNTTVTRLESAVSLTIPSDGRVKKNMQEDVPGLSFISKLRPLTYNYDLVKMNELMGIKNANGAADRFKEKEQIRYSGFIAQEVYQAAKESGYDFSGVSKPESDKGLYGLAYAEMVVPLVKAVQELTTMVEKQQQEIEKLKLQLQQKK